MLQVDRLYEAVAEKSPVCVGLDTDFSYIPAECVDKTLSKGESIFRFNRDIIEATRSVAGCFKVQIAYYEALGLDGLAAIPWTSTQYAFWSMLIAFCFCSIGGNLLVYMAAMKKIPDDLFEAAFMDGATEGKIFFRITLPLIADNVKTQFTFWTIGCIGFFLWSRVFSVVPSDPTTITPASYMYDQIFGTSISSNAVASGTNVGMGAAIGVVLCLITVAAMALINLIFPKEKYEM